MPYLPNEIWLGIIEYCDPRELWLSLRLTDRQLHECAERYFAHDILPQISISLPITLPTYDIRNPMHGKAILRHCAKLESIAQDDLQSRRAWCSLLETVPGHYYEHFLVRWRAMREREGGLLSEKVRWDVQVGNATLRMRLKDARVDASPGVEAEDAQLSFEWRPTVSRFFSMIHPGQVYWSW